MVFTNRTTAKAVLGDVLLPDLVLHLHFNSVSAMTLITYVTRSRDSLAAGISIIS